MYTPGEGRGMRRRTVFAFVGGLLLLPQPAGAGGVPEACHHGLLTLDGRYVLLEPGCFLDGVFDLEKGKLLSSSADKKIAKHSEKVRVMALGEVPRTDAFGKWMTQDLGNAPGRWEAFLIPDTDWVLRVPAALGDENEYAIIRRKLQYAPLEVFREMHRTRARKLPAVKRPLPPVVQRGTLRAVDLRPVFSDPKTAKVSSSPGYKTKRRTITYDPALFGKLLPRFGDFAALTLVRWEEARSLSNATGWELVTFAPESFFGALGFKPGKQRLVDLKGRARLELQRIYQGLVKGEEVTLTTYQPWWWLKTRLVPRRP